MPWEVFAGPRLPSQQPVLPNSHCCGLYRAGQWPGQVTEPSQCHRTLWNTVPGHGTPSHSNGALQSRAGPAPPQHPGMSSSTPGCPQP